MSVRLGIELVRLEPRPAAVLARKVRSLPDVAPAVGRVRKAVAAARVPTAGPPFARFLSVGSRPRMEVGLPLDGAHAIPTLRTTLLPGGDAASLWHTGPAEALLDALSELQTWVGSNATSAGDPWSWYWTELDADEPRMQIVWPVSLE